jgi:L-amino acid N-acyltransferase YncA
VTAPAIPGIATGDATFETEVPDWERWDATHMPRHRLAATAGGRLVGWAALSSAKRGQTPIGARGGRRRRRG